MTYFHKDFIHYKNNKMRVDTTFVNRRLENRMMNEQNDNLNLVIFEAGMTM